MSSKLLEKNYDSEFSQLLINYFPDEKPITAEKVIAQELDNLESKSKLLFSQTYNRAIASAVDTLTKAIAEQDAAAIKKYKWGLNIELANNLWGEWLLGWQTGGDRGSREIRQVARFNQPQSWVLFEHPQPEAAIIRNVPAEQAIKQRINKLAKDVSNSEWKQIKRAILDAIKPQSEIEAPISRRELLKRIEGVLGYKKNKFKNRAERIARTELTFAYNAGRLDTYIRSGLVYGVKYQTIFDERRCPICASRQGLIIPLDDVESLAQVQIPAHVLCRCVWSPVLKTEFDQQSKKPNRQLKKRKLVPAPIPWFTSPILASLLIPEEIILAGPALLGIKKLAAKAGSTSLARAAIASKINQVASALGSPKTKPKEPQTPRLNIQPRSLIPTHQRQPLLVAPDVDLQTASFQQLRSLFTRQELSDRQIRDLILYRRQNNIKNLDRLENLLDKQVLKRLRIAIQDNSLFSLLSERNLTPSTLWVNAGGALSKQEAATVFKLINQRKFDSLEELEKALKSKGIHVAKLKAIAKAKVEREYLKNKK